MRVQALADISRSAICCHSNETRAPIANPSKSAQLEGTPYHSAKLHPRPYGSERMRRGTDRRADTQTCVTNIHFASATPHAKCDDYINLHDFIISVKRSDRTTQQQ